MRAIRCSVSFGVAAAALICVNAGANAIADDRHRTQAVAPSAFAEASNGPALRFSNGAFHVHRSNAIYQPDDKDHDDDHNIGLYYFDRIGIEDNRPDRSRALEFAVERQPDRSGFEACNKSSECRDMGIGARRETGLLYMEIDELDSFHRTQLPMMDYPGQRAELAAEDPATGLKVYREVFVQPPADAPDCSPYPGMDVERYTCQFLREQLPESLPDTPAEVRDALPNLVQPKENYHLILAEEFDHPVDTSGECSNGMTHLGSVWNYDTDPCNDTGAQGVPCFNVTDGRFYFAKTSVCQGSLGSETKFEYKYGYLEVKYAVVLDSHDSYQNLAFVLWSGGRAAPLKFRHPDYGIAPTTYEDMTKYFGVEVDFFEYIPHERKDIYHQYVNAASDVLLASVEPRRSWKATRYCAAQRGGHELTFWPNGCRALSEVTVTKGLEWTPRGYRTFLKVDGVHNDFRLVGMRDNRMQYRRARRTPDGGIYFGSQYSWINYTRQQKSGFFEYLVPGDDDSILEGFVVAHLPSPIAMSSWGYPQPSHDYVRTKMHLDYIRVFKPANGYRDMEPVYE